MHGLVRVGLVTVHEGLQRHKLGELATENLGVSTEVVNHALRSLLVLSEVATLEEAIGRGRRVHEEVWWPVQLDDDATKLVRVALAVLEIDRLDVSEGVLDLVPGLLIVDVVGHRTLVRRVKDDQVHSVLTDPSPFANAERAAGQMVNHFGD